MKIFKSYFLSILTLLSVAPMGAMQVEPKAKVAYAINPDLIKKIETEVNAIVTDVANSMRKIIAGQAKEIKTLNAVQRLNGLINALPLPMNELKQALIKFRNKVEQFDNISSEIIGWTTIEFIKEMAKRVNEANKEIKALLQRTAQIDELSEKLGIKKTVATTPITPKSVLIDESQKNEITKEAKTDLQNDLINELSEKLGTKETKTTTPIAPIVIDVPQNRGNYA